MVCKHKPIQRIVRFGILTPKEWAEYSRRVHATMGPICLLCEDEQKQQQQKSQFISWDEALAAEYCECHDSEWCEHNRELSDEKR